MSWCRHPIAPGSVTQPGRPYFPREKSRETDASVIRSDECTHGFPAIARSAARRRQSTSTRLMREERKNEAHSEIGCADTFDGPDAEQLKLAQLAEIWTKLVFAPHPTALRLTFATNAPDIWSALREEALRAILACCLSRKPPSCGAGCNRALPVARPRGSHDVKRSRFRHTLRRALRDGGDLRRRRWRRLPRRELSQGLGRHGGLGGLPAFAVARSQPRLASLGAGNSTALRPASQ